MLKRVSSVAMMAVVFAADAPAQPPKPAAAAIAAQVDAVFKEYDKPASPGCAVGVYQDDRVIFSRAYGMANLDHDVPLKPDSSCAQGPKCRATDRRGAAGARS